MTGRTRGLLSAIEGVGRRLEVGDIITHPIHGQGTLSAGWEGYLQVEFPSGLVSFRDGDDECLVPSPGARHWLLLPLAEVDTYLADLERLRQSALLEIRASFGADFLAADDIYKRGSCECITQEEYDQEKAHFVQNWMAKQFQANREQKGALPDDEQAVAIASTTGHVQLAARAGSGKTETVANRAVFLQKYCGVEPGEMMLLAFNRDAAKEMTERLKAKLGNAPLPHVMTFHALAYALVPGAKSLLVNTSDGSDQSLNREFQHVLWDAMRQPGFEERVRHLMLAHFRGDWDIIVRGGLHLGRDEMLAYRRGLVSETLRGEYVKSFGEKVIANFLFEHDVSYEYERSHRANGRVYRPDFTLPKAGAMSKGVVIEYFGMQGDPAYDAISREKRAYWKSRGTSWIFIELVPKDWNGNKAALEGKLKHELAEAGVHLRRLSEDEIWERARQRSILRFTQAVSGFVGRCRKQWLEPGDLLDRIARHEFIADTERWFVELASEIYDLYLHRLLHIQKDDFDGLLQRAITLVSDGSTRFSRTAGDGDLKHLRYLFIDEYQDFAELFHQLVRSALAANPGMRVFCVGDDWQAINRFAGSDLGFYYSFSELFVPARLLQLTTNRRSTRSVVRCSNALMNGRGTAAHPGTQENGRVQLVDLAKFRPSVIEERLFRSSLLTPVVLRLANAELAAGRSVVLLCVRNELTDPTGGTYPLDRYLKMLRGKLPEALRDRLAISTVHGFKGNQADAVIVLDAFERSYPLIHPSWVFSRILGETEADIIAESRRLLYVALTRAKHRLFIITETGRRSPFLDEIESVEPMLGIDWKEFPPVVQDSDWLVVKVSGTYQSMEPLIGDLRADDYRYRDLRWDGRGQSWDRVFRISDLSKDFLTGSPWAMKAREVGINGIRVSIYDGLENLLLRCEIVDGKLLMHANGGLQPFSAVLATEMFARVFDAEIF